MQVDGGHLGTSAKRKFPSSHQRDQAVDRGAKRQVDTTVGGVEQRVGQEARRDTEQHAGVADHEQERLANRSGNLHANNEARATIPNAPGE